MVHVNVYTTILQWRLPGDVQDACEISKHDTSTQFAMQASRVVPPDARNVTSGRKLLRKESA